MYPPSFDYLAPESLEEALSLLAERDDAKVLAGGQSLIPLMKLRFAAPGLLVDINRISGLDGLGEDDGHLSIGALVRHKTCERAEVLHGRYGTLGAAARMIADPLVRNRGTVCGSLAHADPQGDWGAALLAMRAEVEVQSAEGSRTVPLDDFFLGPFTTILEPTELVTSVRVPDPGAHAGGAYLKLERKVGDFATAAVAAHIALDDGKVGRAGIALTGVAATNVRAAAAEQALVGEQPTDDTIEEAARLAAEAAQPQDDWRGTVDYKRSVIRVFTARALHESLALAQAG